PDTGTRARTAPGSACWRTPLVVYGQMGQKVAHRFRGDARMLDALLSRNIVKEPPHPVRVAAFGSIGVVPGSDARPKLLQGRQWARPALFIYDGAGGLPLPPV